MPEAVDSQTRITLLKQRPLDLLRGVGLNGLNAAFMILAGATWIAEGSLSFGLSFLVGAVVPLFQGLRNAAEANVAPTPIRTVIGVGHEHVVVGEDRFDRAAIRSACQLAGDPPRVRLRVRRRLLPLDVQLGDQEEVDALLDDLGFAASQRAIAFRAQPVAGKWWEVALPIAAVGAGAAIGAAIASSLVPGVIVGGGVGLAPVALLMRGAKVLVGSDGVLAKRGALRPRFVPFARIRASSLVLSTNHFDVVIEVESERELRLRFDSRAEAKTFIARVRSAPRADADPQAAVGAALSRGEMAPQAWIRRLRALTDLGSNRGAAVTLDRLFAILESPEEPPAQRAAAAVAVSGRADEPAVRLRIDAVAEASASIELRQVIDAIREDDDDDDALAEALVMVQARAD